MLLIVSHTIRTMRNILSGQSKSQCRLSQKNEATLRIAMTNTVTTFKSICLGSTVQF